MLVQPKKAIGTLALLAPDIPGAKLLPSGEWAINRAAALLNFPTLGMKVQIPVWSNKSLLDKVELLINDKMVDRLTITQPAELTQRATLFVPPGIFQSGSWDLAYRVTRYNQAPEPFTPPLKLKVKLEIPAGQDTDPGQGHSNLHVAFRPAEIVQDGVDKDTAENGVDVLVVAKPGSRSSLPYPDIAVGDVSWVSWGGKLEPSEPVIQEQIDDPVKNPIIIHISKDIILDKGDSGSEGLAVASFVRDFADNDSEDWSKATRIVVDTGNSRLDAPILEQADGNELDVDQLDKEPLLLQVFAASSDDYNQGDTIIMHMQGTTLDGESIQVDARKTIDKKPPLVVPVPMDNDGARALAKTQGVFFFDLERGDSIIQRSRGRFINIIGEPTRLAAPIVESEVGGALNPDLPNVIVRIPYDPLITPDNAIEIHWSITLPDDTVFEPELDWVFPTPPEAEDLEGFIVLVPGPEHLKPGEGGTLVVWYEVLSEDENGEIVRRPSPPASPLNIGEPKFELVRAILLGEKDGTFEPKDLPNGISEVTCPDPVNNPTLPKDVVHWRLHDAQDVLLFTDSKTLNSLSAGKAVKFLLDAEFVRQYFEAHRDEQLSIRYHIVRDATGKTSHSNPLKFVVGTAADDKPEITSVMGSPSGADIPQDSSTVETAVTLAGKAAKGQNVKILDGNADKGDATADPVTGIWSKTVTGLSETLHSFTAKAGYGSGQVSDERNFTVTPVVVPTIDKILDDKGKEILQGETTVSPTVTVSGKASKGQSVEIWEGSGATAVVIDTAIADRTTGIWEKTFPLALGPRRLVAKRLYSGIPLWSNDWLLTVVVADPPTITELYGYENTVVPNGGTTWEYSAKDSVVRIKGTATPGLSVRVTGGISSVETQAWSNGGWEAYLGIGPAGTYTFRAEALYGNNPISAPYTVVKKVLQAPKIMGVYANNVMISSGQALKLTQRSVTFEIEVDLGEGPANRQVRGEVSNTNAGYKFDGSTIVAGGGRWRIPLQPTRDIPVRLGINLSATAHNGAIQAPGGFNFAIIGAE